MTPTTLMPLIVADLGLPFSLSTVPIAVGKIAYVLLLVPGGMLVDFYGPRRCVLLGLIGLAFLMLVYATFVNSFYVMVVTHCALAAVASVSGVPVYSLFVAQWFEGGIGLAMGLVLAGYSLAGTAIPAFLGPIASAYGWQVAMACMSCVIWIVALPLAYLFLLENIEPDSEDSNAGNVEDGGEVPVLTAKNSTSTPHVLTGSESLPLLGHRESLQVGPADNKSWTFLGFALSYILLQYSFGAVGENLMFFLSIDRGMTLSLASLYFSALNMASFTAKLIGGHIGDRPGFDRFHVASATSAVAGVGVILLFLDTAGVDEQYIPYLTTSPIAVLLSVVLFGFGYGATFNALYALVPIVFGRKNLGRTQSSLFGLGLAGNAVGSVLTGVMRSYYGTYQRAFLIVAVACITNFFVFNVTRISLGGSVAGLEVLNDEKALVGARAEVFYGIEELNEAEAAARRRIGLASDGGTTPRTSPTGSTSSLGSRFFGAAFAASPSLVGFLSDSSPEQRHASALPEVLPDLRLEGSRYGGFASPSATHPDLSTGTGMYEESGFPLVRDWSSYSLRNASRSQVGSPARISTSSSHTGLHRRRHRSDSTLENVIQSGILSTSIESPGYLGNLRSCTRGRSGYLTPHQLPSPNLRNSPPLSMLPLTISNSARRPPMGSPPVGPVRSNAAAASVSNILTDPKPTE